MRSPDTVLGAEARARPGPGLFSCYAVFKIAAAKAVYREFDRENVRKNLDFFMFKVSVDNLNFKGGFRVRESSKKLRGARRFHFHFAIVNTEP